MLRNLPDIAHTALADAAMGDFEADRFKPVRVAGLFQIAIANAITDEFSDTLEGIHNWHQNKKLWGVKLSRPIGTNVHVPLTYHSFFS